MADSPPRRLILGVDYYIENGRWVFTEAYHRARGYCCQSGCRHCPWGYRKAATASPPPADAPGTAPPGSTSMASHPPESNDSAHHDSTNAVASQR